MPAALAVDEVAVAGVVEVVADAGADVGRLPPKTVWS